MAKPDSFTKVILKTYEDLSDKYEVDKRIGHGAFGDVMLATDVNTKEKKVIKVLKITDLSGGSQKTIDELKKEADILSTLDHPNIIKFYECFQHLDYICIVCEYCEDGELSRILRKTDHQIENEVVIEWFYKLSSALNYLHQKSIIHRDIKSNNVFFKNKEIKLGDFGEAKSIVQTLKRQTLTIVGTYTYMAPEILCNEKYNLKADVWSLGCVFYEIYFRESPFTGNTIYELKDCILNKEIKKLNENKNGFIILIKKMLSKNIEDRPIMSIVLNDDLFSKFAKTSKTNQSNKQIATAIRDFIGESEYHLSFKEGDILTLVNSLPDNSNMVFGEMENRQGLLPIDHTEPIPQIIISSWYHGNITREQADFLMRDKEIGSYLVYNSKHYPGDYTLNLKSEKRIERYRIKRSPKFTIDDEIEFKNLISLVKYYTLNPDLKCLLKTPINVENEDVDYRSIVKTKCLIIDELTVEFGDLIIQGEFYDIYKGIYKDKIVSIRKQKPVHIKLTDECFKEATIMTSLNHPNIAELIGVLLRQNESEILLVAEHMPKRTLHDYVKETGKNNITITELLRFSLDICNAMSYLEEKGIVHRDLAASNVMISEKNIAKIFDFFLSKHIMSDEIKNDLVRIKWTAPEGIKKKYYSNKSDMWSFGILFWEIFSYGRKPYPKIPVNDVLSYIEQGNRMEKPDGCPEEIYSLMRCAWQSDPANRPAFKDTLFRLKEIQALYKNTH